MTLLNANQAKLFLFLEGMVAVSIQFLFLRQLIPFVGASVVVTSIVITFFLAALAAGYHRGGCVAANHQAVLQRNLQLAALGLGFGASFAVINIFFQLISLPPLLQLAIFLLLFMVPTTFLIAQTVPLLINFLGQQKASQLAGSALQWSTVGNVLGGLITTLVIMYWLGVGWAIALNALVLALLSISLHTKLPSLLKQSVYMALLVSIIWINIIYEQQVFVKTNAYANYEVLSAKDDGRYFVNNRSNASFINDKGGAHAYIEYIRTSLFETHQLKNHSILLLGAGGFTLSQQQDNDNFYTFVDIDDQIADIATTHFLPDTIQWAFSSEDGRAFLFNSNEKWDAIVVDAFTNQHDTPWHLSTHEFFQLVKSRLADNGIMVVNLLASPTMKDAYSKRMDNTIRAVFPNCHSNVILLNRDGKPFGPIPLLNVVYTCYPADNEQDKQIYTDNNTQVTLDSVRLKSL